MTHATDKLSAYLDKAMPEAELDTIAEHLGACPECRTRLEELRDVSGRVSGLPERELPPGYFERLDRRRRPGAAPAPSRARLKIAVALAASAIVVVTLGLAFRRLVPGFFGDVQLMMSGAAGSQKP